MRSEEEPGRAWLIWRIAKTSAEVLPLPQPARTAMKVCS